MKNDAKDKLSKVLTIETAPDVKKPLSLMDSNCVFANNYFHRTPLRALYGRRR